MNENVRWYNWRMPQVSKSRLPRFRCEPGRVQTTQITERDHAILQAIYRHRFLRSSHIVALVDGSGQQVLRRLQRLFHHGYVTRPRCQLNLFYRTGNVPIVYGISSKGVRELIGLTPELERKDSRTDWTAKNNAVQQLYLQHTLLVSDIMVAMKIYFLDHPSVRFIAPEDLFPLRSSPIAWQVKSPSGRSSSIYPDAVFALENLETFGKQTRCYYFVEADTGTMPIERKESSKATSFARKLEFYSETWRQNLHKSELEINRFQLLTVTTSAKRSKQIAKAAEKIKHGSGIFLFTDRDGLLESAKADAILEHEWLTSQAAAKDTLRP